MRCQFSFFPSIVHLGVTKEIDSLFMYGPEEAHRDFFDPSYIPTFIEGYYPITSKMKSGMKKLFGRSRGFNQPSAPTNNQCSLDRR